MKYIKQLYFFTIKLFSKTPNSIEYIKDVLYYVDLDDALLVKSENTLDRYPKEMQLKLADTELLSMDCLCCKYLNLFLAIHLKETLDKSLIELV